MFMKCNGEEAPHVLRFHGPASWLVGWLVRSLLSYAHDARSADCHSPVW